METLSKQFESVLKKYNNILIFIKGSPDPDAIASSFAIKLICDKYNIACSIFAEKNISLPQNRAFVNTLEIPIKFSKSIPDIKKYDAYIIVDYQSAYVENITEHLPCAAHIDHHEPIDEKIKIDFKLINQDAGSTSTLISLLLMHLNLDFDNHIMTNLTTALLFGIQTDTDKYSYASQLDYEALDYIAKFSDCNIIKKINGVSLSKKTLSLLYEAINNRIIYKDWLIAGIGFVDELNRDSIAIIADFLLKSENVPTVVVFAAIENKNNKSLFLDASFRSINEHLNLNDIIKEITSEGGARKYKGAYQVNLDYLAYCPDKVLLWEVIKLTTIEVLKDRRDGIYITELKGFYKKFKNRMRNLLNLKN